MQHAACRWSFFCVLLNKCDCFSDNLSTPSEVSVNMMRLTLVFLGAVIVASGCSGDLVEDSGVGGAADADGDGLASGGATASGSGGSSSGKGASSGQTSTGGSTTSASGSAANQTGGAAATGGAGTGPSAVPDNSACSAVSDWPSGQASAEEEVLTLVNQYRASGATCGGTSKPAVSPLTMDPHLRCAARLHSLDMATRDFFSHATWNESAPECSDDGGCSNAQKCSGREPSSSPKRCGKSPSARVSEVDGPSGAGWENIAAGNDTAAATVAQWMSSTGHCNNIMNGSLRTLGVGYAKGSAKWGDYWTQVFND